MAETSKSKPRREANGFFDKYVKGKVIDIDRNITIQGEQAFFKVRCALNSIEMKLQSGYKTKVSKGMTLTSRYIITRRSLFDLLFDKMDDWLNPKQLAK